MLTVAYILNRVISKSISTSYELWTSKSPDLSYMRLWGQLATFTATPIHVGNLALEKINAYLLETRMNSKGCNAWFTARWNDYRNCITRYDFPRRGISMKRGYRGH